MTQDNRLTQSIVAAGIIILPLSFIVYYLTFQNDPAHLFWDFRVYIRAVEHWKGGLDPYAIDQHLIFVYPPLFLHLFAPLSHNLVPILLAFIAASTLCLCHKRLRPLLIGILFCAGLTHVYAVRAFLSGNVTTFLHILIIFSWAAFPNKRVVFYVTLIAASALKPYFLSYLLLPLIECWPSKRFLIPAAFSACACAAIFGTQYIALPVETKSFISALTMQTGALNDDLSKTDIGNGIYAIALEFMHNKFAALLFHVSTISVAIYINLKIIRKILSQDLEPIFHLWFPVMIACMANPRLKVYDSTVMTAAAAVIIYNLSRHIPARLPILIIAAFCSLKLLTIAGPPFQSLQTKPHLLDLEPYIFVLTSIYLSMRYYAVNTAAPLLPNK